MPTGLGHLIRVFVRPDEGGGFLATSDDLPNLFLLYPHKEQVVKDIPAAITMIYKAQYGQDVNVTILNSPGETDLPVEDTDQEYEFPVAAIFQQIAAESASHRDSGS